MIPFNPDSNECSVREYIGPLLIGALLLLEGVAKLQVEKTKSGSLGNGSVDYVMIYRKFCIVLTKAKKLQVSEGVAQNIAQLVASREAYTLGYTG